MVLAASSPSLGFNATFIQREIHGQCKHVIHYSNGRIISHVGTGQYRDDADCQVTIGVEAGKRIFLRFDRFDVAGSTNCFQDEVLVYDGTGVTSPMLTGRLYGLCGSLPRQYRAMHSSGNQVTVRFITDGVTTDNSGFAISYVSYFPAGSSASQSSDCFPCQESAMCIDRHLMCDNLWHCPEGSDETFDLCYGKPNPGDDSSDDHGWLSWTGTHLAMAFAGAAVLFIVVSLIFCCCCHRPSPENFGDGSGSQVIADANMYYVQQAKSDVNSMNTAVDRHNVHIQRPYSSHLSDGRYDVVNADVSDAVIGCHPTSAASTLSTDSPGWWESRRSSGDGCQAGFSNQEAYDNRQNYKYPNGVDYHAEMASTTRQDCYVTNMSFIEQQELRWQYLTGQHQTRVSLPPEHA
ncbi:uncharacterized protein [Diadema antillarum]|uniref:uncharacterized protein n=1 Tax=Diadema antillarum TaxID=105358 RepID=UPI003A89ED25